MPSDHSDNSDNSDNSEDHDKNLFKQLMTGVKPLRPSKQQTSSKPTRTAQSRPKKSHVFSETITSEISRALSNPWETSDTHAETCLSYGKHRIQHKQFCNLKQGKIPCEARLDLHGLRLEQAGNALVAFITHAHQQSKRCVLVIHGKGGRFGEPPILKTHINHWLKQLPEVIAFHSACARDGGHGALYVLLKRNSIDNYTHRRN